MRVIRAFAVLLFSVGLLSGCSVKRNTALNRRWHAFNAHFNTLYNGQVAFEEGEEAQTKGNKDDYTRLLPMYECQNVATQSLGSGNFDTSIEKAQKAIKQHSIKKKPAAGNRNRRMTPEEKEFRARREFNPYLWRAWFMMAEAQFRKGEFIESSATWNYIIRLYATQPRITQVARARLARCYVALGWPYDAEDVLRRVGRDSLSFKATREKTNTEAAYYLLTEQYDEALPRLEHVVKHTKGRIRRARLNFLIGQLYNMKGEKQKAYSALSRVVAANPPYEMTLAARVLQTEVMGKDKSKQMIRRLRRMAKDENNTEYLDQIYYAIGNIYLSLPDTANCLAAWEKGVEESTGGGPAKASLLLKLSEMYWARKDYINAARTYQACAGILSKELKEYKQVEERANALQPLAPHLEAIKLQDSLQTLAKLPEAEYLAAIDRVIEALKKKEKEEEKKQAQAEDRAEIRQNRQAMAATAAAQTRVSGQAGAWYFYNTTTVTSGKAAFRKKWGERKNEDNWRRTNKTILNDSEFDDYDYASEDSLAAASDDLAVTEPAEDDPDKALKDSLANDPHQREYYLRQIPFTEDQLAASNTLLSDGLYNAGILEQENVENFSMAKRTLERLMRDFPEYEKMEDVYYHMFLICGRLGLWDEAQSYRQKLIDEYADGEHAVALSNPLYEEIARRGRHMEDSLYQNTFAAYIGNRYEEVGRNYEKHTQNFPEGAHRARMMFVQAMSLLYSGDRSGFLSLLKELIQKYSKEEISEMAAQIVKGVQNGRLLQGGPWDASGIWGRRFRDFGEGSDSTEVKVLTEERVTNYAFVLAYEKGSLDEDQLLFEVARYNFSNFMVRNFELEISDVGGISMLAVKGFLSYDEVHAYAQMLYSDEHMATVLEGIRSLLIAEDNLKLLGVDYSFDDYETFYEEKIQPIEVPKEINIDENQELEDIDPEDVPEGYGTGTEAAPEEEVEEDDFPFGF